MTLEATVLIVDDEVRVLDSLEALLAMDYRVLRAGRPGVALELLAREPVAVEAPAPRAESLCSEY